MIEGKQVWQYRWFVLAACFLVVNIYGVVRPRPPLPAEPPRPGVTHFAAGSGGVVSNAIPLVWNFATDMVGENQTGEFFAAGPYAISPPVEGLWIWDNARSLRFVPEDPWRVCNSFHASPRQPLADVTGTRLNVTPDPGFRTEAFRLVDVEQIHRDPSGAVNLRLSFNDRPRRENLKNYVVITQGSHSPPRFRLLDSVSSTSTLLRVWNVAGGPVTVRVKKGLRGMSGPLGLTADAVREVPITLEMKLRKVTPSIQSYSSGAIRANFSLRPDASVLGEYVTVSPPVDCVIHPHSSGLNLAGAFEPGGVYTVRFRAGLPAVGGQALADDQVRTVYIPNRPAAATLHGRGHYLSAAGNRLLELRSVNVRQLKLTAERIYPNNLVQFAMRETRNYPHRWTASHSEEGISRLTGTLTLSGAGAKNQVVTNRVDLTSVMGDHAAGAYQVTLGSTAHTRDRQLVVISDIGIAVKSSPQGVLVWANSLHTLQPIAGATVRVYSQANQEIGRGRTDPEGLAELTLPTDEAPFLVTLVAGDDINYLCLEGTSVPVLENTGGRTYLGDGHEAYVFSDRGIYRPGETTHVHAVVRDANLLPPSAFPVLLEAVQPDGQVSRRIPATLSELGTAGFDIEWPDFAPTGRYALRLVIPGDKTVIGSTAIAVESFVPPTIAVDLHSGDQRCRLGEELRFELSARHLFGAPAAGQPARARLVARPVAFNPDGWPGYRFGDDEKEFSETSFGVGKGSLDDDGRTTFQWTIPDQWRPPAAVNLLLVGTVSDSGGRTVTAFGSRQVDPYPYYLGIHLPEETRHWRANQDLAIDLAAVQPDGSAARPAGPVQVRVERVQWLSAMRERQGRWVYESTRHLTLSREQDVLFTDGKARLHLAMAEPGAYLLSVTDPATSVSSSTTLQVYLDESYAGAWSKETPDRVILELDRANYQAGDIAHLHVKAPFPGKALVTLESDRVLSRQVVELTSNSHRLELPVRSNYMPNVYCTVTLLRPVVAEEIWSPHRAVGAIPMVVTNPDERMQMTIQAPETIRPQSPLQVRVATGRPGKTHVVLAAIDEGICRLTDFQTPDPLTWFRAQRRLGVSTADLYSLLLPELGAAVDGTQSTPGGDMMGVVRGRLNPIRVRRFKPTALWSGPVMTDANGVASIELEVPEFTGELRLMAIAVGRRAFGSATARTTVKRPLVVRSSLPRFLAPNDTCIMPIRVFNETGGAVTAAVSVACDGPLRAMDPSGKRELGPGASHLFDVPLKALESSGIARVHLTVEGGTETFRETIELPIRPASPRQVLSDVGVIAAGETVTISLPHRWLESTGRHQVWCAGLPTLNLAGGLDYLLRYPYGCVEQTTSSAFPLLYLADLAALVKPGQMTHEDVVDRVDHAIHRLWAMQHPNGGFGQWNYDRKPYHWGSIYATHFLVEAKRAGYEVDDDRLQIALGYLGSMLGASSPGNDPAHANWREDRNRRTYACHVLALAGQTPTGWVSRLHEELQHLTPSARIHLAAALALSGRRADATRLLAPIGPANIQPAPPGPSRTLESPTRNLALRLATWLLIDPAHAEVGSLARRLNDSQTNGRWRTTQENAISLLALGVYSRYLREQEPEFTAVVSWAGGLESRTFTRGAPLYLAPDAGDSLVITNQGPGPVHYYWRSSGVPTDDSVEELDQRLSVRRTLLDRRGEPLSGARVSQGDLVVIELALDSHGAPVDDLVVEDLLPAGLEIENARLMTSDQAHWIGGKSNLSVRHADARDDRMLVFTGAFSGAKTYYYAARAVTPGDYALPPVGAEGMYEPEIRSLHGRGRLEVVP